MARQHVAPVPKGAEFTRHGRTFRRVAPNGDQAWLVLGSDRVLRDRTTFKIMWTITQWEWWTRNDPDPGVPKPNQAWTLTCHAVPWLVRMLDRDELLAELGTPTRRWIPA